MHARGSGWELPAGARVCNWVVQWDPPCPALSLPCPAPPAHRSPQAWRAFQASVSELKLRQGRMQQEAAEARAALEAAARDVRLAAAGSAYEDAAAAWEAAEAAAAVAGGSAAGSSGEAAAATAPSRAGTLKVVLVTGFESFNVDLYRRAAVQLATQCPAISLRVFSDRDLGQRQGVGGVKWGWTGVGQARARTHAGVARMDAMPLPVTLPSPPPLCRAAARRGGGCAAWG